MTLPFLKPLSIYASRSETTAVFAFYKAEPPLVWRYDLTRDPTVTLTLHEHAKGVEVGFLRETGSFVRIVDFPERECAEEALYKIASVIGSPFIRWGRVLLLSVVLAFAAFVVTIVLSSYVAHTKLAPLVAELSSSGQFPALPATSNFAGGAVNQTAAFLVFRICLLALRGMLRRRRNIMSCGRRGLCLGQRKTLLCLSSLCP